MRTRLRRAVLAGAFGVMAAPSPPAAADELTVTLGAESAAWVRPTATVNLRLSRPLAPDEGSLAVFVGETDWSALARLSGEFVELRPTPLRLPRGESEVTVYLVSPAGAWREVGRVSIRVLTDGGFERAEALPTLELGVQAQPVQGRVPELPPTPRDTFYDGTVRLGLKTTHVRNGWTTTSQANAVGVTYRNEAVRFALGGDGGAPARPLGLPARRAERQLRVFSRQRRLGHAPPPAQRVPFPRSGRQREARRRRRPLARAGQRLGHRGLLEPGGRRQFQSPTGRRDARAGAGPGAPAPCAWRARRVSETRAVRQLTYRASQNVTGRGIVAPFRK